MAQHPVFSLTDHARICKYAKFLSSSANDIMTLLQAKHVKHLLIDIQKSSLCIFPEQRHAAKPVKCIQQAGFPDILVQNFLILRPRRMQRGYKQRQQLRPLFQLKEYFLFTQQQIPAGRIIRIHHRKHGPAVIAIFPADPEYILDIP